MNRKPIVAIVGRPNVGKSTLVNRLIGSRASIVDDMPGVTRDRIYFEVEWASRHFTIVDTGGIIPGMEDEIMVSIYSQAEIAAMQADAIIFVVDGLEGITPVDEEIANILRRYDKRVFLTVNKIDSPEKMPNIADFYELAMGDPYAISSLHGSGGVGDLLDDVIDYIPEYINEEKEKNIKVAIVGKPNAGKSSLFNALIGEDRVIVSEVAGTTRDAIDTEFEHEGTKYTLVDTAGMRKKSKVDFGVESFSVNRSIKAIKSADVTLLMVDALEGLTDQDKKIINLSTEHGRAIIIAVNKWDLVEDKTSTTINEFTKKIRQDCPFINYVPIVFISAVTKQRLTNLFPMINEAYESANKRVQTSVFNRVIMEAFALNPPPIGSGKRLKAYYSLQVSVGPPTFALFVNDEKLIQQNYMRYLENKIREAFGFTATPIKIVIKQKKSKEK
ncbi:MAG: ribosome biogenesis GTPase Der [bacterium]